MPRAKRPTGDERVAMRLALNNDVLTGGLEWSQAVQRMRQALGMTRTRFAQTFKLTRRLVAELEAGTANPTAETLAKLGKPFGYQVGFVVTNTPAAPSDDQSGDAS